jgi:hypothetical protein
MIYIIFNWVQDAKNVRDSEGWDNPNGSYWGIGDIIRGIITTYIYCKKKNYKFRVSFRYHPLYCLLKNDNEYNTDKILSLSNICNYDVSNYDMSNTDFIWEEKIEDYIEKNINDEHNICENNNDKIIHFMHNQKYNELDFTEEIKNNISIYLREIFTPNKEILQNYLNLMNKFNIVNNYKILHFRLGDNGLIKLKEENSIINKAIKILNNFVCNNETKNLVIITDNTYFKKILEQKYDLHIIQFDKIGHFGKHKDLEKLKGSLLEYYFMILANNIISYSVYKWNSGFAKSASIIGNNIISFHKI